MTEKTINPTLKTALELGPVIAFFVAYLWLKDDTFTIGGTDYDGFMVIHVLLLVQKGWLTQRSGPHARCGCASCRACRRWSWAPRR